MHLGDIYKSLTTNHFVVVQSFATMINEEFKDSNSLLIVISPLMIVDGFIATDPTRCMIGTQKEIEDKYIPYLKNDLGTKMEDYNKALDEDIKPKIEEQEKIDMEEVEDLLSKMTNTDIEKFKEDIDKIIKGEDK